MAESKGPGRSAALGWGLGCFVAVIGVVSLAWGLLVAASSVYGAPGWLSYAVLYACPLAIAVVLGGLSFRNGWHSRVGRAAGALAIAIAVPTTFWAALFAFAYYQDTHG